MPLPGAQALARMLQNGIPEGLSKSDLDRLTRAAAGQSAADVDGVLRQARSAARAEARVVTPCDVLNALSPAAQDENPARDHRIALHECGHAIVDTVLGVGQVTRLSLSGQGGQAWLRLNPGEGLLGGCEVEMACHLAGRAAERLILGTVTAGSGGSAASDLAQATTRAVLDEQRDVLLAMAAALEERRMLEADDLKGWLVRVGRKPGRGEDLLGVGG